MPKIDGTDEQSIIPSVEVIPTSPSMPSGSDDQRTVSLVSATVAATLSQLGVGSGAPLGPQSSQNSEARRIAELALVVLDGCGIQLDEPMIELHDGSIISDMMVVRAYKELVEASGRQGVNADEVIARLNKMQAEHDSEVARAAEERGIPVSSRGDTVGIGSQDSERKGIFR